MLVVMHKPYFGHISVPLWIKTPHLAQTSGPDQGHRGDLPSPRSPAKLSVSLRIPRRVGIPQHA